MSNEQDASTINGQRAMLASLTLVFRAENFGGLKDRGAKTTRLKMLVQFALRLRLRLD